MNGMRSAACAVRHGSTPGAAGLPFARSSSPAPLHPPSTI